MNSGICRVAALQMVSRAAVEPNLAAAAKLVERAADAGARLIVLPEYFALMATHSADLVSAAEADGSGPIQDTLAALASRLGVWIVGGTVPIRADAAHVYGALPVYDDNGRRVGRYDKIHLFDASAGERHHESSFLRAGAETLTVASPFGRLGLAVCYDLRFPELFRRLADAGADMFIVPSAFTAPTGAAHWDVLTRARAIENLTYVIAAAQGGRHDNGRATFGNSLVVDPWGTVIGRKSEGEGVILADIDMARVAECRERLPARDHRRF